MTLSNNINKYAALYVALRIFVTKEWYKQKLSKINPKCCDNFA